MPKILIIEDQPIIRENIALILEMEGCSVISAPDGAAGLELARTEHPDLILCDILMPKLDGYGVLQGLRAQAETASLPFIFLTAKAEHRDQREGMNLGADDYLTKPVDRAELIQAVHSRLQRQRTHDARARTAAVAAASAPPNFTSSVPLRALGISERESEVLLWVAQGKTNAEIGLILGAAEKTVKRHMGNIFEKLGLENRSAAALRAVEVLRMP